MTGQEGPKVCWYAERMILLFFLESNFGICFSQIYILYSCFQFPDTCLVVLIKNGGFREEERKNSVMKKYV